MSVIVTDTGFGQDDWTAPFTALADAPANNVDAIDLDSDTAPEDLTRVLNAQIVRIDFPSFADGRGFTLARRLRDLGFTGRIRAHGHVISDQYAMARRSGFDEIEISDDLAARQPQDEWQFRADWTAHCYQARLRA